MCDCLLCVKIADTNTREKRRKGQVLYVLSLLFIENILIEKKDYKHFMSSVIGVRNFHPLIFSYNYYYFCRCYYYCCCLVVASSCVFRFFCLVLQVTLINIVPLNFTVTIQSHTKLLLLFLRRAF
jgi:hypothetical protein